MAGYSQYLQPALRKQFSVAGLATAAGYTYPNNAQTMVARGRTYTRTTTKKRKLYPKTNSVKAQMLRCIDNHHCTASDSNVIVTATHNTIYTNSCTPLIVQGTSNTQRIGDKIHLDSLRLNGWINTPTASGAYTYRVMILWSGNEYNNVGLGSGLGFSEVFLPSTGSSFVTSGIVNPKAVTVLYDEIIVINSLLTGVSDAVSFTKSIPLRQDFMYENSAAVYGKTKNLYFVVMGSVSGGTPATTVVGSIGASYDIVFKPL